MIIKNGYVFDFKNNINGENLDILIKEDKIIDIKKNINQYNDKIIDANSLYVIPGIVDIHSHLRTPGQEYKEDIASGSKSAAKGGITTILIMPNTIPPLDNEKIINEIKLKIKSESIIDIFISSCMTKKRDGKEIVDIDSNINAGTIAFTDDGNSIQNREIIIELCKKVAGKNILLIEHPEFIEFAKYNNIISPISYGENEKILKIKGQLAESESLDILTLGLIAGVYNTKVHFTHISTEKSVEAIRYLKKFYPNIITCDCTPHHLILNEHDLIKDNKIDLNKKINPPLRPENDRISLEKAIIEDLIDCIASDHAPHSEEEKNTDIFNAPFGTIGFETLLPACYTYLVKTKKISMIKLVKLLSYNPYKILLNKDNSLSLGNYANITIFDPNDEFILKKENIISKSKNSAFLNNKFFGSVKYTIYKGKIVYPFDYDN